MSNRLLFPAVIGAAVLGWLIAFVVGEVGWIDDLAGFLKTLFLSALRAIVAPLIFFSLISGILRLTSVSALGGLGSKTILYYLTTTSIAIILGLTSVFLIHPWTYTDPVANLPEVSTQLTLLEDADSGVFTLLAGIAKATLINPIAAIYETNILALVVNAIAIAIALLIVTKPEDTVRRGIQTITDALFTIVRWVIWTVPVGVLGIVYQLSITTDVTLIVQLMSFSLLVVTVTLIHGVIVLPSIAFFIAQVNPLDLFRAISRPMIVAFTTASSAATVPVTLQAASDFGIKQTTRSFVVPFGATANMDGSALYEGIAAVFVAYLFGVDLSAAMILVIFFAAMAASVGAPGIPSGSMVAMQMVLLAVGLPLEAIAILLVVERPLDMIRTACNVEGDLVCCTVVDHYTVDETTPVNSSDTSTVSASD